MFKLGADYKDDLHTLRALQGATPPAYSSQPRAKDLGFDRYGVFGEGTYSLDDVRRVVAGLRFDQHEATDYRKQIKNVTSAAPPLRLRARRRSARRPTPLRTPIAKRI